MALPMFQHLTRVFDAGKLSGDFVLSPIPAYSTDKWMNGSFQAGFDRYIEDRIGFRNFFVRLNNQIDLSLFGCVNAEGLVAGKNNILYEYDYIRAYTGGDFIGKRTINRSMNKLKFLQEHLKKEFNIDIILIFEPSKARVQPEFIPDRYLDEGISLSNYEYFKQKAEELNINHLDLNHYLNLVSDTIRYPVYPPYGIHWSEHTMSFVTDTLVRFIEAKRNIDMPEFSVETRIVPDSISASDYDAGMTANLLFTMPQPELPYPFFTFYQDTSKQKPRVLAVADSYYWNIFNTRLPQNLFANQAFWYFNAKVYPDFYFGEKWVKDLDIKKEVEQQDVILLGVTERFLYKFGWEFVDQLYDLYTPKYSGDIVEKYEISIRNFSQWFDQLHDSAVKKGVPLESLIRANAHEQAIKEEFETYLTWYGPRYYKRIIREDLPWRDSIVAKANRKGVDFETQLEKEAMFVFESNHPEIFHKHEVINAYVDSISNSQEWMKIISEKAENFYMPVDEMVKIDAEYMAWMYLKNETPFKRRVRFYENLIRNTPEWLATIKEKAREKDILLDEMIKMDATYMANEELKKKQENE